MDTVNSLLGVLNSSVGASPGFLKEFIDRAKDGSATRDENPKSHFCVYFFPYNAKTKEVFIVHHKKSGLWISPGGHIDRGENLLQALNREINEELGMEDFFEEEQKPFLLTITPIDNNVQPCKAHYDVWYLMPTDGKDFNIDEAEFFGTKWLTIEEARKIVISSQNLEALEIVEKM